MKTFNQFLEEAKWGKQPLPKEKMLNQIGRHKNYAGWVTGYDEADRWNKTKKRTASAKAIADVSNQRAQGIIDVLMDRKKKA